MSEENKDKSKKSIKTKPIIIILIVIVFITTSYIGLDYTVKKFFLAPSRIKADYSYSKVIETAISTYIVESDDTNLKNISEDKVTFDVLINKLKNGIEIEDIYNEGQKRNGGPYIDKDDDIYTRSNPSIRGYHIGFEVLIDTTNGEVLVQAIKAIKDNYTEEEMQGRAHRINLNWKSKKKENDPTDAPIETDATNEQITPKATESIHEPIKVKEGLIVPQKYVDFMKNNNLVGQSDDIIFFEEADLNLDGETEVVIATGYCSEESYSSYSNVHILKEKNDEIEMMCYNIANSGYSVCGVKLINLQNMPQKYIYFQLTNTSVLRGFKIIELSGTEIEVICYSASPTGVGNDELEDFNNDGQYDGYTTDRWSYDVSYFSSTEVYKFINGKFVFDSSSVDLPDYPKTPEDVIDQYFSLKHTSIKSDEVYERMSEICENEEARNIDFSYDEYQSLNHALDTASSLKIGQKIVKQTLILDDGNNETEATFTMEKEENKWRIINIDKRTETLSPPFTKPPITNIPDIEYPQSYHHLDYIDETKLSVDHNAEIYSENLYRDLLFSPIGWSKDGKLAYVVKLFEGGVGAANMFRWGIQDMVTDELLWYAEKEYEEYTYVWNGLDERELFKLEYSNYIDKYKEKLDEYGIIIDNDLKLEKFPLTFNENNYNGRITDKEYIQDIYGDLVVKYKVVVERNGELKIFCINKTEHDYCYKFDVAICGYIKSPYEPRIAVVISEIPMGFEGPPLPINSIFVGCHLEKGYDVIVSADEALELLIEKFGPDTSYDGIDKETGFYMFSWANPGKGTGAGFLVDPYTGDVYMLGEKTSNLFESSDE